MAMQVNRQETGRGARWRWPASCWRSSPHAGPVPSRRLPRVTARRRSFRWTVRRTSATSSCSAATSRATRTRSCSSPTSTRARSRLRPQLLRPERHLRVPRRQRPGRAGGRRQLRVQVPHRDPRDRRRRRSVPLVPRRRGTVCTDHGPRRAGLGGPRPAAALRRDDGQRPPPHADRTWPDRRAVECRAADDAQLRSARGAGHPTSRSPASRSSPDSGRTRSTSTSAACSTRSTSAGRSRL